MIKETHVWGKIVVSGCDIGYRMTQREWRRFRRDVRAKVHTFEKYVRASGSVLWIYPDRVDAMTAKEVDVDTDVK